MLKHFQEQLSEIAVKALIEVAQNNEAPAAARAAASRTLLETVGRIGRLQSTFTEGSKALAEMSAGDLANEIARLKVLQKGRESEVEPDFNPFEGLE